VALLSEARWTKVAPFNPLSSKQALAYLKLKGYKIPLERKSGKPTANEEALENILRYNKDPLLELMLDCRHLSKAVSYLQDTAIGRDGKFHPIYSFKPETGRLSSVRPNMQNVPNGGVDAELAKAVRSCIVPSQPGMVLLECDWKACEAVLTGWFAGDDEYIAASQKDSHSWFGGYILRELGIIKDVPSPKSDGFMDFAHWLKKEHPKVRKEAKQVNLATGYGMQWKHLSEVLRCSAAQAKRYLAIKAAMAPKIEAWKNATWLEAHRKGFLETPFGYRSYFWNVLQPIKSKPGKFRPGKEANEALAFRPQSTGAAMLREVMLEIELYNGIESGGLFNMLVPIHDAILVECFEKDVQACMDVIVPSMARSWVELGGLSIGADCKSGPRWSEMEEED
jgi:DNA polymerase-1